MKILERNIVFNNLLCLKGSSNLSILFNYNPKIKNFHKITKKCARFESFYYTPRTTGITIGFLAVF